MRTNYSTTPTLSYQYETLPSQATLSDTLLEATFSPNRAIGSNIERLDLSGSTITQPDLQAEVIVPLRSQLQTADKDESGKILYASREGITISDMHVGTARRVEARVDVNATHSYINGEKVRYKDRSIAAHAHTHPVELPPSPQDLISLFYESSMSGANTAIWVVTESGTWVVFRGENTPQWSAENCIAKRAGWNKEVRRRIAENTMPNMSETERLHVHYRAEIAFLRQAAQTYGLKVFVGRADDSVLERFN